MVFLKTITYGINFDSILNSSHFFHVTEGMVPDIMHDVLEGVAPYEVKEMLKHMISSGYFTLSEVNKQIENFPYNDPELKSKPSIIPITTLDSNDHKLNQEGTHITTIDIFYILVAAQMWTLARFLPFLLGHKIPEDDAYWENFLLLLSIIDIIMAPVVSQDEIAYLRSIIEQHHSGFKGLYPSCSITPKFHYMVHYPEFISR